MPTKSPVRGKGAIAIAAQVTTENKLKVTAIEIRPAKKRGLARRHRCIQRAAVAAPSPTPLANSSRLGTCRLLSLRPRRSLGEQLRRLCRRCDQDIRLAVERCDQAVDAVPSSGWQRTRSGG